MLVLTRKVNECVVIGSTIRVRVLGTHKGKVRLGFTGPPQVPIHREEIYERIKEKGTNPTGQGGTFVNDSMVDESPVACGDT
jgi:carbon storage regulator